MQSDREELDFDFWRKKKTWIGTVSGTLSHYSPQYFISGQKSLNEPGWWKLSHSHTPAEIAFKHVTPILNEVGPSKHPLELDELCQERVSNEFSDSPVTGHNSSSTLTPIWNYLAVEESDSQSVSSSSVHQIHSTHDRAMYCRAYVQPSATLSNCLFADDEENKESLLDIDVDNDEVMEEMKDGLFNEGAQGSPKIKATYLGGGLQDVASIFLNTPSTLVPILPSCTPSPPLPLPEIEEETLPQPDKSLFSLRAKKLLAESYEEKVMERVKILSGIPMSEYMEAKLLKLMKRTLSPAVPSSVRRLLRKLTLRKLKYERGLYLFSLDRFFSDRDSSTIWQQVISAMDFPKAVRVLDRYKQSSHLTVSSSVNPRNPAVLSNLISWCEPVFFRSPYTHRTLKPFIRRDRMSCPLWVQLMIELTETVKQKKQGMMAPYFVAPIDYSYINAWHIPAINSLAREFFWPGIDLSDCLLYPDFSCVVMYRKLVVGFAVMVPDVGHNEAYISFLFTRPEWRRAGIASFMLYHLIQTCMGKDITLHVSATNPALILYQKFGFKVEEFIQDFYEMYLPLNSRECKHALFLRLCR